MKIKCLSTDNIRKFYKSTTIQIQLNNLDYEMMLIDKFSINFKHNTTCDWVPVGVKGDLYVYIESVAYHL